MVGATEAPGGVGTAEERVMRRAVANAAEVERKNCMFMSRWVGSILFGTVKACDWGAVCKSGCSI